ncbi:MAG: cupin domain-containing protein [Halioglobus sp.]|nr:cupin domain-containing protein [Halioglobus sp.]
MKKLLLAACLLGSALAMSAKAEISVLGLDADQLRVMELESIPPWPDELVLSGTNKHWQKILHLGEFAVVLYESEAAVIDVSYPFPYDEYVLVIEGEVILTSTSGERQRYGVGDSFVVPKGWTGTWDMPVKYREKIVVERKAWDESEG